MKNNSTISAETRCDLPDDVIRVILSYMVIEERLNVAHLSKRMKQMVIDINTSDIDSNKLNDVLETITTWWNFEYDSDDDIEETLSDIESYFFNHDKKRDEGNNIYFRINQLFYINIRKKITINDTISRAERELNIIPDSWDTMEERINMVMLKLNKSDEIGVLAYLVDFIHHLYYDERESLNVYGELQGEWKVRVWTNNNVPLMESMNFASLGSFSRRFMERSNNDQSSGDDNSTVTSTDSDIYLSSSWD